MNDPFRFGGHSLLEMQMLAAIALQECVLFVMDAKVTDVDLSRVRSDHGRHTFKFSYGGLSHVVTIETEDPR